MTNNALLLPMFVQVLLTLIVWLEMFRRRFAFSAQQQIDPQSLADANDVRTVLKPVQGPANNLVNLFEMPVLFYVAVLTAFATGVRDMPLLILFWIFVGFRCLHSLIHLTSNKVMQRFQVYAISSLALWGAWGLIAFRLYVF